MGVCLYWEYASIGCMHLLGVCIYWAYASIGSMPLLGVCLYCVYASIGNMHLLGICIYWRILPSIWAYASIGHMHLLGICLYWRNAGGLALIVHFYFLVFDRCLSLQIYLLTVCNWLIKPCTYSISQQENRHFAPGSHTMPCADENSLSYVGITGSSLQAG